MPASRTELRRLASVGFTVAALASAALLVTTTSSAVAASSKVRKANEHATLTYGATAPLVTFDPAASSAGAEEAQYLGLVYDTLVKFNAKAQPEPDLATSWKFQSDTEVTFTLRTGVTYQDGSAFNATTAVESLDRSIAAAGPRSSSLGPIAQVKALDPTTLRILLKTPDPDLLFTLASAPCDLLSPEAFNRPNLNLDPDGTGAYFYDAAQSTPGDHYTFVANPKWWNKSVIRPHTIVFKVITDPTARLDAVQTGQVDLTLINASNAAQAKADGLRITATPVAWTGLLILDRAGKTVPAFASLKVREAIAMALDRPAIVRAALYGYGSVSDQPILKGVQGYDATIANRFTYNLKKARHLIAESGYKNISFTAPVDASTDHTGAEILKAELAAIGINMTIQLLPTNSLGPAGRTTQYPVITFGFPNYDPYGRYLAQLAPAAGFNPFHDDNPALDALATQYAAAEFTKPKLANKLAAEMSAEEVDQGYIIVAAQADDIVASSPKVTGIGIVYGAPNFADIHFS